MTIPNESNYPSAIDNDTNLYLVRDFLRVRLLNDYNPGDTQITVEGDAEIIEKFPPNGIITLTEQVSEIDQRAISLYYNSRNGNVFNDVELLPNFEDVQKLKKITNVTQNVMAEHHNAIKSAIKTIEEFVGVSGNEQNDNVEGRTNLISKVAFDPKAWFTLDNTTGLIPLEINFQEQCFRTGDDDVEYIWDFGDQDPISSDNISYISVDDVVPADQINVYVVDTNAGPIKKTYTKPGIFTVKLTVKNQYGEDSIEFPDLINARIEAPNEANILFLPKEGQENTNGDTVPLFSRMATEKAGTYDIIPTIRASINDFITAYVPQGVAYPGRSFGGEELNDVNEPIDRIVKYVWDFGDDIEHSNSSEERAIYSIGGLYDLTLRTETEFGAFRITSYKNCIDIIEKQNLWLFTFNGTNSSSITGNEFGLISETFKVATRTFNVSRDDSFLDGIGTESARAKREFKKNTGFKVNTELKNSGSGGVCYIFWASGGSTSTQKVNSVSYNGFSDTYSDPSFPTITLPWNWLFFSGNQTSCYFLLGSPTTSQMIPNSNGINSQKTELNILTNSITSSSINNNEYVNGASDLLQMPTNGFSGGEPLSGRFATYRYADHNGSCYFLRNNSAGLNFQIKSFYRTLGSNFDQITGITKLPDMTGTTKVEGQLVSLIDGLFFFNNSGNISAFNSSSSTWETGGPSTSSLSFRSLQDQTKNDFDSTANTLLACSDGNRNAYLSFDYSNNSFVKFSSSDLTFSMLSSRPTSNEQWIMSIY